MPSRERPDRLARVPWGAIALYIVLAFGLSWLIAIPLWRTDPDDPSFALLAQLLPTAAMLTPALAALAAVLIVRVPRADRARFLGLWPLRPARRVVWFCVAALFGPIIVVALSGLVAWACGWYRVDLAGLSGFQELNAEALPDGLDPSILPSPWTLILTQLISFPLLALIPNSIFGLGEELGWRGWLLPALRPLGIWPALILSGIVWGLWHAPFTLLGHNYGLTDWRGVALMTANCVLLGIVFGWIRLRSASVWPCAIAHGSINGCANMPLWFIAAGAPFDPALASIAGVSGWIVLAALIVVLIVTGQFRREPQLAARRNASGRPLEALG